MLVEPTYSILNPTTIIPLKNMGDKHTSELKQLEPIFNMALPSRETPPSTI